MRTIPKPATGPSAGTRFTVHEGDLVITKPGTVISGLDIHGFVDIKAANVTIKDSIVRGRNVQLQRGLIQVAGNALNAKIVTSTLRAAYPWAGFAGVVGGGFAVSNVEIHDVVDPVHIVGGNVSIKSSWLHGSTYYARDVLRSGTPTHDDSVQIQSGSNITIVGSWLTDAHNAAIQITQDAGKVSNVRVESSFLDHGACTINIAEKGRGAIAGLAVVNSVFGLHSTISRCSIVSPPSTKVATTGSVFTDGAAAVVKRGS